MGSYVRALLQLFQDTNTPKLGQLQVVVLQGLLVVCLPVVLVVHLPVVLVSLEVVAPAPLLSQFSSVFAWVFFAASARTLPMPARSVLQCRLLLCAEKNP